MRDLAALVMLHGLRKFSCGKDCTFGLCSLREGELLDVHDPLFMK